MKHINLCSYCGKHNPSTGVKKDSPGSKRDTPGSKKDASNVPYKCHHCDKYFPQKQNLKNTFKLTLTQLHNHFHVKHVIKIFLERTI